MQCQIQQKSKKKQGSKDYRFVLGSCLKTLCLTVSDECGVLEMIVLILTDSTKRKEN